MVKRAKGARQGTRYKLRKHPRQRGKVGVSRFLQKFEEGDKVIISPEPSVQRNTPFRRFIGKMGKVIGKRGKSYIVEIKDGRKLKNIICLPVHLRRA